MDSFSKNDIKIIFADLCCSQCKNDFECDSLTIKEEINGIIIANLVCMKCGKDFGDIILKLDRTKKHIPFEVIEGPAPISKDDVIDAHEYIKKHL